MKNLMFLILSVVVLNVTHGQINFSKQKLMPTKKIDVEIKPDLEFSKAELDKIKNLSLEEFQLIKDLYVGGAKPQYLRATICSTKGNRICASVNWSNWSCKKLSFYMEKRDLFPGYEIDSCKDTSNGIIATISRMPTAKDNRASNKNH